MTGNRGGGKGGERRREIKRDVLSERGRGKHHVYKTLRHGMKMEEEEEEGKLSQT